MKIAEKLRRWGTAAALSSMLLGIAQPAGLSLAAGEPLLVLAAAPKLLITELVPDTANISGSDGYEFIEVYNNSDAAIEFASYGLFMKKGTTEVQLKLDPKYTNAVIAPHGAITLWVINDASKTATTDSFNANFKTALEEGTNLFRLVSSEGMSNSAERTLIIRDDAGADVISAKYENDDQTKPDQGIFYQHPAAGENKMVMMPQPGTVSATPGQVADNQLVPYVKAARTITHTPRQQAAANQDYKVDAVITGGATVAGSVYFKTNLQQTYAALPMTASGTAYSASIPSASLIGASELTYYIQAQDGSDEPVKSAEYTVQLTAPTEPNVPTVPSVIPSLLITELVPDTSNVTGVDGKSYDAYEFIEVYNNTNATINFKDYKLSYEYEGTAAPWTPVYTGDMPIPAGQALVLWVTNAANKSLTAEQFNGNFGTSLTENLQLFRLAETGGMHNSNPRKLVIYDAAGAAVASASYQNDAQTIADKGIFYQHPAAGLAEMAMMPDPGTKPATPGAVAAEQLIPAVVQKPVEIAHTPAVNAYNNLAYAVSAVITGGSAGTTASVYYKTDLAETYASVAMTADRGVFKADIPAAALAGAGQLTYYIEARDGSLEPVKTAAFNVKLVAPADDSGVPPLLITELLPNSDNVTGVGTDAFEFIEIYNNTQQTINFKDYKVYYRYTDSGPDADVVWNTDREDLMIAPGKTLVFWIINSANKAYTVAQFNQAFGTSLTEGEDIVKMYSDGMANGSKRGIAIGTNTHKDIAVAYYDGTTTNVVNKGFHYTYPTGGATDMIAHASGTLAASPGSIEAVQVPQNPNAVKADTSVPVIADQTGKTEISEMDNLAITADVADETAVKTVALYYRTDAGAAFTKRYLYEDYSDKMFHYAVFSPELVGRQAVEYYFEASDGTHTVKSDTFKVNILSKHSHADLRLNVKDGDIMSGARVIKGTSEHAAADDLKLAVDGKEAAPTYHALEEDAYFAFEVTGVNYYFKNAVTMGKEILYTFMDPINTWTTLTYPIDASRLAEGANEIAVRAATKSGPFDDRAEENKDDFKIRNVRLVLADGTVIYDPKYANPEEVLAMGDSANTLAGIEFQFALTQAELLAKAYAWTTTDAQDGAHAVSIEDASGKKISANVTVDNTAPAIQPSVEEGKAYRGAFTLNAGVTDPLAGVQSVAAKLDGTTIDLPYAASSGKLAKGEHVFEITAIDKAGNKATKTIRFTVPDENPSKPALVSPTNGLTGVSLSPLLAVKLSDPLGDTQKASFYRGFRYDGANRSGLDAFIGASETEPPKKIAPDGEKAMAADDWTTISTVDKKYLTTDSAEKFPYHRFAIDLDKSVKPTDRVEVKWRGHSLEGRKVSLYAWNKEEQKWDMLTSKIAGTEDFELTSTVEAGPYNTDDSLHVLVQDEKPISEDPYDFSFIWMSDTQYYSESYPQIYTKNVQWIVDNEKQQKIRYVIHTGDIVDEADQPYQWENANKSMSILDKSGIPYGVLAGNHDVAHQSGDYRYYWEHYGENRFNSQPTYGASYQNNRGHYDLVSAGGNDFIIVYMGWNIGDAEIEWVNKIVSEHPDRKAILAFHEYMLVSANRAPIADEIYERVVVPNKNVIMTLSGHYHDAENLVDEIDDNGDGKPDRKVYQMLADYQGAEMGGLGYIRLLQFDLDNNKVHVKTYSPYLDDYNYYDPAEYPKKDEFDLDVDLGTMNKQVATDYLGVNIYTDQLIGKVDGVVSGGNASVTWSNLNADQLYQWYVRAEDNNTGSTLSDIWSFTTGNAGTGNPSPIDPVTPSPGTGGNTGGDKPAGSENSGGDKPPGNENIGSGGSQGSSSGGGQGSSSGGGQGSSSGSGQGSSSGAAKFADVPQSHWAHSYIQKLAERGVVNGTDAKHYAPGKVATRAEFAKLIAGALGIPSGGTSASYTDVAADSWYAGAAQALTEAGIMQGDGKGQFQPTRELSRQEMAVILVKAYEWKYGEIQADANAMAGFKDGASMSAWAKSYIAKAVTLGLLQGQGGGLFAPAKPATRAECAKVVYLLMTIQE
ncbi:S-layer homology domain-containing protein [Paenibacillus aurantiacus]|uniref:S-layer homology domain-containing protein n=1 Tax=Paenibacillus aurantiacus TaxID=1936118 RepID=A0ABV5KUS2_9BACL